MVQIFLIVKLKISGAFTEEAHKHSLWKKL
jgi:hypothetical protein